MRLIAKEGVTFSHCVPTILHMLLGQPGLPLRGFRRLKMIIGGSALPKGLCKAARQRGINIFSGYGMSETCPVLTVTHLKPHMLEWNEDEQIDIRCRTGLPLPLVDLRVVDPEGRDVPHDGASVGEVVVRARGLLRAISRNPSAPRTCGRAAGCTPPTSGAIDQEGYLQVTDRIKDVIKTGGEWISSLQIEDILTRHEAVSEAAVIGSPDESWGERPYAIVTIKEEHKGKVSEEDLKSFFQGFVRPGRHFEMGRSRQGRHSRVHSKDQCGQDG